MCKKIEVMDIYPEWARTVLEKDNTNNRNISKKHVAILAEEMTSGTFQDNGDTIRFSADGTLLDGQHRLAAVVKSGIPLRNAIVVFGLESDAFKTIDSGRARSNGDRLKMLNIAAGKTLAAAAKGYIQYMNGDLLFKSLIPNSSIIEVAQCKKDFFAYGKHAFEQLRSQGLRPPVSVVFIFALCYEYNREQTEEFVSGLATGINLQKGDPRYALRTAMIRRSPNSWWNKSIFVQCLIKAINAFFNGEKMSLARFSAGDKYQELFFTKVINGEARIRLDEFSKRAKKSDDD